MYISFTSEYHYILRVYRQLL